MSNFAEELKEARKAAGMTQQAMADRMLIPKRTIEDWERSIGKGPPPYVQRFVLNELRHLAASFHFDVGDKVEVRESTPDDGEMLKLLLKDFKGFRGEVVDRCCHSPAMPTYRVIGNDERGQTRESWLPQIALKKE